MQKTNYFESHVHQDTPAYGEKKEEKPLVSGCRGGNPGGKGKGGSNWAIVQVKRKKGRNGELGEIGNRARIKQREKKKGDAGGLRDIPGVKKNKGRLGKITLK